MARKLLNAGLYSAIQLLFVTENYTGIDIYQFITSILMSFSFTFTFTGQLVSGNVEGYHT